MTPLTSVDNYYNQAYARDTLFSTKIFYGHLDIPESNATHLEENKMENYSKTLPETGFIRINDVLELIPIGKSSWWNGIQEGIYPKPVCIGKRVSAWRVEDVRALISKLSNQ